IRAAGTGASFGWNRGNERARTARQAGRSAAKEQQFVGLDESQAETAVCVVEASGVAVWRADRWIGEVEAKRIEGAAFMTQLAEENDASTLRDSYYAHPSSRAQTGGAARCRTCGLSRRRCRARARRRRRDENPVAARAHGGVRANHASHRTVQQRRPELI